MKRKGFGTLAGIVALVVIIAGLAVVGNQMGWFQAGTIGPGGATIPPGGCQDPGTARTVNVSFNDIYSPGSTVTSGGDLLYRMKGDTAWTSSTSFGFTDAVAGATYEIIPGLSGTGAITAHPQPINSYLMEYTVPCTYKSTVDVDFADDEAATSLTFRAEDPTDGSTISATNHIDIDNGAPVTIPIDWYAGYEENFGTMACGRMSNVYVVRVNTTEIDDVDLEYEGQALTATNVPSLVSSTSGMKDYAFFGPVIESTKTQNDEPFSLTLDPDDTVNPSGETTNYTISVYDSFIYIDNDDNQVKCGVEDEDGNEIGATAADTGTIYVTDD